MTIEQSAKLIEVLERIAAALEKASEPQKITLIPHVPPPPQVPYLPRNPAYPWSPSFPSPSFPQYPPGFTIMSESSSTNEIKGRSYNGDDTERNQQHG